jgi:putative aldouronate transport system permease protein
MNMVGEKKFTFADGFLYVLMALVMVLCLYPFLYILANSFSDPVKVIGRQVLLWPQGWNVEAYRVIFGTRALYTAYGNTLIYTMVGTALGTFVTLMCAYPLSRPRLLFKRQLTMFFLITMYFSGGMVPAFIWINKYGLYDTRWALILPAAFSCYNMIIARTNFTAIPEEIIESAVIEGAGDWTIFLRIAIRLSAPVIAVIALYNAVYMWNVYFNAILYISNANLYPLQVYLSKLLTSSNMGSVSSVTASGMSYGSSLIMEQIRYPAIIVTTLPVLLIYPFVQRFFVKGVMLGSVKG